MIKSLLRYFGGYLLGVFACLMFSHASLMFAGVFLLPAYVIGALPGLIYVVYCAVFEPEFVFWFYLITVGLLPLWIRLYVRLSHKTDEEMARLIVFRPLWTTFPIGFLGTFGVYAAGSASV